VVCVLRYFNSPQEAQAKLPFDAGFESVGVVTAVGAGVTGAVATGRVADDWLATAGGVQYYIWYDICHSSAVKDCSQGSE
jgi:Zn-dependent alcohol dehydrogenase